MASSNVMRPLEERSGGHALGIHRVIRPNSVLPQAAEVLDASLPIFQSELLILVDQLNIDSASFRQLMDSCGRDEEVIAERILHLTRAQGKMQNPITGSGGMLIGEVLQKGETCPHHFRLGERIATMVSLTLTPLHLEKIFSVELDTGRVHVKGHAVLFPSGCAVRLPADLSESCSMALLDVAGAGSWVRKVIAPQDRVLIVGAGKSGALSAAAAREIIPREQLWISDIVKAPLERFSELGIAGGVFLADAQKPCAFSEAIEQSGAEPFDWVINTCNAPETEMACILAARSQGKIFFFNMATQFSRAVLSAEGISKEVMMLMGEGYREGHGEYAFYLIRNYPWLRYWFDA